jgi:hypothetical protein
MLEPFDYSKKYKELKENSFCLGSGLDAAKRFNLDKMEIRGKGGFGLVYKAK